MFNIPKIVVIILTWNQKQDTLRCLESFDNVDKSNVDIVLIDNNSTDDTRTAIKKKYPSIHYVYNSENKGAANGRNTGIDFIKQNLVCDYVLFLDNDTTVTPNFLNELVKSISREVGFGLATPKIYKMNSDKIIDDAGGCSVNFYSGSTARQGADENDYGQYDLSYYSSNTPSTCCLLVNRQVVEECGGFDESYDPYGYEDLDFSLRAINKGYKYLFVPTSIINHKGNKTGFSDYTSEYASLKGRNLKIFLSRYSSMLQKVCFALLLPILGFRTIVREMLRGNIMSAFSLIKSYLKS